MAVVQGADLVDVVVDAGPSAKCVHLPGMARVLGLWMRARWMRFHRESWTGSLARLRTSPTHIAQA